ncbi:metallophosphoesterase [Limnochorda sp.]|uniref:metallophosphoesterase n=1 Tax=Limnochorda sp. TaxID=1940279 RepID=UPI0018103656|nr:hypothetical protein [Bacillota bacterium]NMA71036.1 metallophosphoesterase [Bacillota bacterium]
MSWLGWSVAGVAGGLLVWSLVEPHWPKVERRRLERDPEMPGTQGSSAGPAAPLRLLHLADPHLRKMGWRERRTIALAERLQPDLICLTGDLVAGSESLAVLEPWAAGLARVAPVFAVLGDHDLILGPEAFRELEEALRRAGVHLLRNRSSWVSGPGWRVWVVGVDDAGKGMADLARAMAGDREAARQRGVPLEGDEVRVLLSHRATVVDEAAQKGFHLVLAGDTHGGQVNLPWLGPIAAWLKERTPYPGGLYRVGRAWLHVSRGLGWSHLPVRFRCRPEVALLEIPLLATAPTAGDPAPAAVEQPASR